MKVLGLDMSKYTGYAVAVDDGSGIILGETGLIESKISGDPTNTMDIFKIANNLAFQIAELVKRIDPNYIYIEQTNAGAFRFSQKQLEFIHCMVLHHLDGWHTCIRYVDTSSWRSVLKIRLSKDQKKHNKQVREKKIRGKITTKHLAVSWANETYGLSLKLKDNDIADAIAVASYGINREKSPPKTVNSSDLVKDALNL